MTRYSNWAGMVARQAGNTTAAAKAAKESGGFLVVRDYREVRRVERDYGCRAIALNNPQPLAAQLSKPLIFDADAVVQILLASESELERGREERRHLREELSRLQGELRRADQAMARVRKENEWLRAAVPTEGAGS